MGTGQFDNNMQGVLFKNDRKSKDSDPDYKGSAEINHEEMWLAAWIKKSQGGKTFMKLSFRPKQEQQGGSGGAQMVTPQATSSEPTPDDDIPF